MSVHTTAEFIAKVDEQLIWRRRELTDLRVLVQNSKNNAVQQSMLVRSWHRLTIRTLGRVRQNHGHISLAVCGHTAPYTFSVDE
jgi:hypothetical protein